MMMGLLASAMTLLCDFALADFSAKLGLPKFPNQSISRSTSRSCVDFTGVWKGNCSIESSPTLEASETIELKQSGCESLNLGDFTMVLDGVNTTTISRPDTVGTLVISSQWVDATEQKLKSEFTTHLRFGGVDIRTQDSRFWTMEKGKLHLEGTTQSHAYQCNFQKQ